MTNGVYPLQYPLAIKLPLAGKSRKKQKKAYADSKYRDLFNNFAETI